jgi:hypothetical protein
MFLYVIGSVGHVITRFYRSFFAIPVANESISLLSAPSIREHFVQMDYEDFCPRGVLKVAKPQELKIVPTGMSVAKAVIRQVAVGAGQAIADAQDPTVCVFGCLCRLGDTRSLAKELAYRIGTGLGLFPAAEPVALKEPASWQSVFGVPMSAQASMSY